MKNFFYASFVALLLLLVSCEKTDIDDGTGTSSGAAASFVMQPVDIAFDTNLERWDEISMFFKVDTGSFRIHSGSFSIEYTGDYDGGDYYTTSIEATDENDVFELIFRAGMGAADEVDSLEVPAKLVMVFNGFNEVMSDEFRVIIPADKYAPEYAVQPTTTYFKAGFIKDDYCETTFEVSPMDAIITASSFSIVETDFFTAEIEATDSANVYIARFYATQELVDYAAEAMLEYEGTIPDYAENTKWGGWSSIAMTPMYEAVNIIPEDVISDSIFIQSLLMNVDPEILSATDSLGYVCNFDETFEVIAEIEVNPGTKNVTTSSITMTDNDMFSVLSVVNSSTNKYQIRLNPTETAIGGWDDGDSLVNSQIILSYDDYGNTKKLTSDIKIYFSADSVENPSFTTLPQNVTFATGSTTSTTVKSTFILKTGTVPIDNNGITYVENDYFTATCAETSTKNEWEVTFKITDKAILAAHGSDTYYIPARFTLITETGDVVVSDEFNIAIEPRLVFDSYIYQYIHTAAVAHVEAFDDVVPDEDIISKGIVYSTDPTTDKSTWVKIEVDGLNSVGNNRAYKVIIPGLTPGTTYYVAGYAEYNEEGQFAYATSETTTKFTTYASRDAVPVRGNIPLIYETAFYLTGTTATPDPDLEPENYAAFMEVTEMAAWYLNAFAYSGSSFDISAAYIGGSTFWQRYAHSWSRDFVLYPKSLNIYDAVWGATGAMSIQGNYTSWINLLGSTSQGAYTYTGDNVNALYYDLSNQSDLKMTCKISTNYVFEQKYGMNASTELNDTNMIALLMITNEAFQDGTRHSQMTDYATWDPVEGIDVALRKPTETDYDANGSDGNYASDCINNGNRWTGYYYWLTTTDDTIDVTIDLEDVYDIIGFNYYSGVSPGYAYAISHWEFWYEDTSTGVSRWIMAMESDVACSLGAFTFDAPITCQRVKFVIGDRSKLKTYLSQFEVMIDYPR